jgi:hypothetical protein
VSFSITPLTTQNKELLITYFRERGQELLSMLREDIGDKNHKDLSEAVNKTIQKSLKSFEATINTTARLESWSKESITHSILTTTYAAQVAMLELRNEVWPYNYMDFSRRIGELWEHFVLIPFVYSVKPISPFVPPLFSQVRSNLRQELQTYISSINISQEQKDELLRYYEKVWVLVNSGEINLLLDSHILSEGKKVNIDFKSGFGSNEKGNTNRLLMVGTVYKNLEDDYHCILLVRSEEDTNNHYFRILKNSGVWQVFCGKDAYSKITDFTGFDLTNWILVNINWEKDLSPRTYQHFFDNNLIGYLKW